MTRRRILLVSYHFYPSPEVGAKRPSETALHLMRRGYDVTVVRAWERDFATRATQQPLDGLRLIEVRVPPRIFTALWVKLKALLKGKAPANAGMWTTDDARSAAPRGLGPLAWCRRQILAWDTLFQGSKRWLLKAVVKTLFATRGRKFDLVIASGPPMVSYIAGWALAALKGARLILDYRDPWYLHGDPELSTVMLGHPLARFENRLASTCAARCAALIAASPGTKRHILEHFPVSEARVHLLRNGFDVHAVVDTPPEPGRLEMLYAGSLYWNRNPFPFLEALAVVLREGGTSRAAIRCRFVGNCEEWKGQPLRPWIAERRLEDVVEIVAHVSPQELKKLVARSHVLINFAQGQKRQIPAKSYDYIAARRDALVITESDSDVADLFREAGIGSIVEPNDEAGFAAAIRRFCAKHVHGDGGAAQGGADLTRYSRETQVERFAALVSAVLGERVEAA
jgi:glycosyltransferase involved in cell wall biosynthesis